MSQCSKLIEGKPCGVKATTGAVMVGGKRVARCSVHTEFAGEVQSKGPVCPCCDRGFVQQWAHVDHGKCYRCGGKGHWKS